MSSALEMVVSKNRLEGSLADVPLQRLLDACFKHLVTGSIKVTTPDGRRGVLLLRAGAVDQARFGDAVGDTAVDALGGLGEGTYELAQRLPDLSGHLGGAAALEGQVEEVALIPIMRLCEQQALSCTIIVIGGFDRGEIVYRAGELVDVTLNGMHDDDAIVAMLGWPKAKFRVVAPPLHHEIQGWPKVGREATQPFRLDAALLPPKAKAKAEAKAEPKTAAKAEPKTEKKPSRAAASPRAPSIDEREKHRARERHERRLAAGTDEVPRLGETQARAAAIEVASGIAAPASADVPSGEGRAVTPIAVVAVPQAASDLPRLGSETDRRRSGSALLDAFLLTTVALLALALAALLASHQ
jgi:hypothetical protein